MRQQVPADLRSEIHQLGCLGFLWNTVDLMRWMLVKQGHGCTIPQSSPFFAWWDVETMPSHGWFMTLSYQHYKGMLEINTKWCRISNTHQYEINGKHMKYSWVSKTISYPSPRSPKWFATHPGPAAASGLQDQDPSMPAISDELGSCPKPPSNWVFDRQKKEPKQGERKPYWNFPCPLPTWTPCRCSMLATLRPRRPSSSEPNFPVTGSRAMPWTLDANEDPINGPSSKSCCHLHPAWFLLGV